MRRPWSRTNLLIRAAAVRLGMRAEPVASAHSDFFMRLRWPEAPGGERSVLISKTRSPYLTQVAQTLSNNKFVARELLARRGLPVVEALLLDDEHDPRTSASARTLAEAWLAEHGRVVVKPNWGNRGIGVVTGITTYEELVRAYAHARALDRDEEVLVEPELPGINLRAVVIGARLCGAVEVRRPCLVGDGERTGAQLLAQLNADPRRGRWDQPELVVLDEIEDDGVEQRLALLGHQLDTVLPQGLRVELCSDEVEVIDRTQVLAPRWGEVAVEAADALGIDVAGVDLRGPAASLLIGEDSRVGSESLAKTAHAGEAALLEVNALPALHLHELPTRGAPQPVSEAFVSYCLQLPGAPAIRAKVRV